MFDSFRNLRSERSKLGDTDIHVALRGNGVHGHQAQRLGDLESLRPTAYAVATPNLTCVLSTPILKSNLAGINAGKDLRVLTNTPWRFTATRWMMTYQQGMWERGKRGPEGRMSAVVEVSRTGRDERRLGAQG